MKKDLEEMKQRLQNEAHEHTSEPHEKRPRRRAPSADTGMHDKECIFCGKDKFQKNTKSREKLAVQLRADQTLRQCTMSKQNTKILAITSQDIVAAQAHYHVSRTTREANEKLMFSPKEMSATKTW